MTTAEHFDSADRLIATARAAWEEEKKALEQRIFALEAELKIKDDALFKIGAIRDEALRTTARLLTQFGIVSQVFEDAKRLALEAGLYTANPPQSEQEAAIARTEQLTKDAPL